MNFKDVENLLTNFNFWSNIAGSDIRPFLSYTKSDRSHAGVYEHSYKYDHGYHGAEQYTSNDAFHGLLGVNTRIIVADVSRAWRVRRRRTSLLLDGRYIWRVHHYNTSQTTGTVSVPSCCCCWRWRWWWIGDGSSSIISVNFGIRWIGRSLRQCRHVVAVQLVVDDITALEVCVFDEDIFKDVF